MAILAEEKKKFFDFLDILLSKSSNDDDFTNLEDYKTDGGVKYPKEAYLYVPDPDKPSTWKLRIWETPELKVTRRQLGRAAAAFSAGGFRGQKVELPSGEVETVKKKLVALYKKDGAEKEDIPAYLFDEGGDNMAVDEKRLEELEKSLKTLSEKYETEKKEIEASYTSKMEAVKKDLEASNKKLEDAEKRLAERDKDLHKEKIDRKASELIEKGFWPAIVEKVKKVMLEDVEGKFSTIKLDDKTEMSISDVLCDILETIPTEVRINLEEIAHINKNTDPNKKYMSDVEVEEYAKEKKLTYQDACSVLAKEGKIEL